MEPVLTKSEEEHLKFKPFVDEEFAKMILANKIVDDNIRSSNDSAYVRIRELISNGEKYIADDFRKYAFFDEMKKIGGNWKVNWEDEIRTYYNLLPYHDQIDVLIDGKRILIPKKTYMPSDPVDKNIIKHIQYQLDAKMGGSAGTS